MKTFREFMKDESASTGTYVAARLSEETQSVISDIQDRVGLGLVNRVKPHKLHSTIQYSRKQIPWNDELGVSLPAIGELELWETSYGNTLVMHIGGEAGDHLKKRHQMGIDIGGTYDYDEYKPHITLSYNHEGGLEDDDEVFRFNLGYDEYHDELKLDLDIDDVS